MFLRMENLLVCVKALTDGVAVFACTICRNCKHPIVIRAASMAVWTFLLPFPEINSQRNQKQSGQFLSGYCGSIQQSCIMKNGVYIQMLILASKSWIRMFKCHVEHI